MAPLQAVAWLKWIALGAGLAALGLTAATSILRGRDLGVMRQRAAPPADTGRWRAGRAVDPDEWRPQAGRVGVCLSGGGIRSASFCLGALQAIGQSKIGKVRYVTSVSGGGYMAAAWAALTRARADGHIPNADHRPFRPGSPEERWVRHHTDYLVSNFGLVAGGTATLIVGLLINLTIVFVAAHLVAHPLGWVIRAARPEMKAQTPIVEIRRQPRIDIEASELIDAELVDKTAECTGCIPTRRPDKAYEIRVGLTDPEIWQAEHPTERLQNVTERYVSVAPGLVAEGDQGLVVVRQPLVVVDNRLRNVEVVKQPRLSVKPFPELTAGRAQAIPETAVRSLVEVDRHPTLGQQSGTNGREDLKYPVWLWWLTGILVVLTVGAFLVDFVLRKLFQPHVADLALLKLTVATLAVLLLAPILVRSLPGWVSRVPGYDDSNVGWGALAGFGVAVVPLVLRFRGSVMKRLGGLNRFRGKGYLFDGLVGVVVLAVALTAFLGVVDVAAANSMHGRLRSFLDPTSLSDIQRWWLVLGAGILIAVLPFSAPAWSLYTVYRDRLGRAYFLDAERDGYNSAAYRIAPMTHAQQQAWILNGPAGPRLGCLSDDDGEAEWVICTTANIRGAGEAAPGRAAGSFTFSRSWVGGPEVGWLPTGEYLDRLGRGRRKDVFVPSLVTISGAAFSPAMGKNSRSWQGRLFALGNLRLGVWVPTPMLVARHGKGRLGYGTVRRPNALWYVRELVGWFDRTAPYVYLTDGGHWENLGLVELLRRGCTDIWMISAAGDGPDSFETLAQAMALAREELQVEFDPDFELEPLRAAAEATGRRRRLLRKHNAVPTTPKAFVAGTFRYVNDDGTKTRGTIHVIEATLLGDLPWDVHAYAEANDDFPDIPTGYQLMHHRDFEAYRMLGYTQAKRALAQTSGSGLAGSATDGQAAPRVQRPVGI